MSSIAEIHAPKPNSRIGNGTCRLFDICGQFPGADAGACLAASIGLPGFGDEVDDYGSGIRAMAWETYAVTFGCFAR